MVKFSYYGHSAFLLDDGKYKVLVDPFITGNPKATVKAENVKCDFVLVSHAHGDHLGNAPEIAYNNGAAIVTTPEVISEAESIGRLTCHPMNLGGSLDLPFGRVRMTPALHSAGVPEARPAASSSILAGSISTMPGIRPCSATCSS